MDVKNVFLNYDLSRFYVHPPLDYPTTPSMVCKLRKVLYGLKQAPRPWFGVLLCVGYRQSPNDYYLFMHSTSRGKVFVLLYVDDILIIGDDSNQHQQITFSSSPFR